MSSSPIQTVVASRMLGGAPTAPVGSDPVDRAAVTVDAPKAIVPSKAAIADDFQHFLKPQSGLQKVSHSIQHFYRGAVFGEDWGGTAVFGTMLSGAAAVFGSGVMGLSGLAVTVAGSAALFVANKVGKKRQLEAPVKLDSAQLALTDQRAEVSATASDVAAARQAQSLLEVIATKKINDAQTIAGLTAIVQRGDTASADEKARAERWSAVVAALTLYGDTLGNLFAELPENEREALAPLLREHLFAGSNTRHSYSLYELFSQHMPPDFPEISVGPDHGVIAPRTSIDALELLDAMAKFYKIDSGAMASDGPPLRESLLAPERTDFERALVGLFAQRLIALGAGPHHAPSRAFLSHLVALGHAQPEHALAGAKSLLQNVDRFTRSAYVPGHPSHHRSYSSRDERRTLDELIGAMRLGVAAEI